DPNFQLLLHYPRYNHYSDKKLHPHLFRERLLAIQKFIIRSDLAVFSTTISTIHNSNLLITFTPFLII
ncbi:hypothetical protein F444_04039, partial [Phytophthora nicotianae P1976]